MILSSYVINSEAMKKIYKTMKGRQQADEPKDLGREWHSDSRLAGPNPVDAAD